MVSTHEQDMSSLAILNHPPSKLAGPELLHELILDHGEGAAVALDYRHPDGSRSSLSYDELHRASDALAARISAAVQPLGSQAPFIVPVLAPQGINLYVALLSILKAGGAFCPLNLDAPPERVKFIFHDVSAKVVLCTPELATRLPQEGSSGPAVILLDNHDFPPSSSETPSPNLYRSPLPTDLAYVMYTSGSTGTPKGVGVSHSAATQSLLAHELHIPPFSRFLQFAAPTFDVSVFEIFFPLSRGKTLVSCSRPEMLNDLPAVIRDMDVDACELTPTVAGSLLRKRENAPCLRLLLTIGEMLTKPVVEEFAGNDDFPSILWAMYGPTEAAIHCSLQSAFDRTSGVGNIGSPLDTVSAFVLRIPEEGDEDKSLKVLSVGEIGELAVGGFQLASGYLNRPDQTAAAFVESPYGPIYRTGDKARFNLDGTMECLGRISDGQVKLRGQRLELGEVEQAALRSPGCRSALAAIVGSILVLFCAGDEADNVETRVQETCKQWLPAFMVPGDIVLMEEFPRLPSGKTDRKLLVANYERARDRNQRAPVDFKDDTERQLCQVASEVLGIDINPSMNLPMAGLDSLNAIKLASAICRARISVSAVEVLSCKTIAQLHGVIRHSSTGDNVSEADAEHESHSSLGIDVIKEVSGLQDCMGDIEAVLSCTPLQASMLAETISNPTAYCNWIEIAVPKQFSEESIHSWIIQLSKMNGILRTGFAHTGTRFVQVVWKDLNSNQISIVDQLDRDFTLDSENTFLPPLNIQICSLDDGDRRLLLHIHHALYDGWTVDMLLEDINTLSKGEEPDHRPQFGRVLSYIDSTNYSEVSDMARGYWAEHLGGYQPSTFPNLVPTKMRRGHAASKEIAVNIDPVGLKNAFREFEFGPQVLFQAALMWLWSSLVGNEDVVIGTVTSGRTIPVTGVERIMGPCIASVPLRADMSRLRTVKDLLETIHAANRAALPHSILPLSEIQKVCNIPTGHTLYDVLFVYQESLYSQDRLTHDIREICHHDAIETKLLFEVEPKDDGVTCRLTYHLDVFPDEQAVLFLDQVQFAVQHFFGNTEQALSSIRANIPANLTSQFNMTPKSFTGTPDLAMTVEAVALQDPDKEAVCFARAISKGSVDAEVITFRQLNKLGNQVARLLHAAGMSPGSVVAIVMDKSVLLYAGILGIIKAGCSYLPLLPNTPPERIATIFSQACVSLCLTDTISHLAVKQLSSCRPIDLETSDFQIHDDSNLNIPPDPSRIANIIYTSGSTGLPKGVCVTQLNISSNLDALSKIYPVSSHSRLLQSCSQAFDVSVFEIFFAWTQGMCLCSAVNDVLFEDLEMSIRSLEVTHLSMTPTVASLVHPENIPAVEFLVTSGEPMTEGVAQRWAKQLYQGYGPSETTNICTVKKMSPGDIIQHLGWSFENTSTVVLYRDGEDPVPYGCVGEFCFGGDQVVQGYLKMPDLTSTKFIDHPRFGRLYRSGDLGRMLPDGSLVILGRVDDQIKLRGQRIELNEINSIITQSNKVSDCMTLIVNRGGLLADQLASFYVVDNGAGENDNVETLPLGGDLKTTQSQLFRDLLSKVPSYMVPSYLIPISRLPLTASGKLDKTKFREIFNGLEQEYLETASLPLQPIQDDSQWSEQERRIADMVSTSLSVRLGDIQRWTPLTSLGLDSISAIGLSRQLHHHFKKRIPVSVILQNLCVARLAGVLDKASVPDPSLVSENLKVFSDEFEDDIRSRCRDHIKQVEKILPCTPLQEAMLVSSTNQRSYLNTILFRLSMDQETVKSCWRSLISRHSILRTCFVSTTDNNYAIAQVILEGWEPTWLSIDAGERTLDDCISLHAGGIYEAIDSMEPPISFAIIKQHYQTYLSFICHHALYDAVAIERLLFEVEELVHGHSLPPAPSLEPFLKEALRLPSTTTEFWNRQLAEFDAVLLPQPECGPSENCRETWSGQVDVALSDLHGRSKDVGFSLLSLCQASWASVLGTILQVHDVCFGNVVSGRGIPIEGINELVAPCFNTIPVRVNLSDTKRNIDLIKTFHNMNPVLLEYQFTPLRLIQRLITQHGGSRLFDTVLLLQQPPRLLDGNIWTLERDDGEMDVPLVCEFIPDTREDKLLLKLHYETSNISNSMIILISDLLRHSIKLCIDLPDTHIPVSPNIPRSLSSRLSELGLKHGSKLTPLESKKGNEKEDWTETELHIKSVLANLSGVPEASIRRQTTIYQLGLDSINAVQIASHLRKDGLEITAGDVIEHNSAEKLALRAATKKIAPRRAYDLVEFQNRMKPEIARLNGPPNVVEAVLPCTSLQTGMLVQFIRSAGRDYFNFLELRLEQGLRLRQLDAAWAAVVRAHPMLRTGFVSTNHTDSPFVMVQYGVSFKALPVLAMDGKRTGDLDIGAWRRRVSETSLNRLHEPPWHALHMEADDGLVVHLAILHALYDAHSLHRLLDDLTRACRGNQLHSALPTEAVSLDIIDQVQSHAAEQEEFWKRFADKMVINKFPTLTPLKKEKRAILVASATSSVPFSDLEALLKASGSTMQATIQAAWTRILASYLGEAYVTFGTVLSGRNSEATKDAVFPCITTLPVIACNDPSNRELLNAMLKLNVDLYKQQHVPLTNVQRWVGRPETRLFDTLLVYQRFGSSTEETPSWKIVDDQANIDYPVSIEIEPSQENKLEYRITFFDDVVPTEQAHLLLEQLDANVCYLLTNPDGQESDLFTAFPKLFSTMPAQEPNLASEERLLHEFVEFQARHSPSKPALRFVHGFDGPIPLERTWSYQDLDRNGNMVAQMLPPCSEGGKIAAIHFEKCPEAFFAILGALKAGYAFVALDPDAPAARKEFILKDSGASILLSSSVGGGDMGWVVNVPLILIDEEVLRADPCNFAVRHREVLPSDVCYCLYTSGTTGTPKGCEITHENAVQAILAFQRLFTGRWDESSNWLQFASFHFDVAVLEQYWSWSVGITLVGAPRDLILGDLAGVLSKLEITHIDLTPSLARLLHPDDVPSLAKGVFITGGELLKQEILDKWGPVGVIYNAYGPTEATIGVTTYPRVPVNGRSSNIGKQFANVGSYVLQPGTDIPVFKGAVGELCVAGKLVGKGYLNRQDLTAERFPTLSRFGERVYRTGDLVRILHDGCFDFLGRADDQVKLRGQRLEIGEINHAIRSQLEDVTDVATIVARNEKLQKDLLVSFVVTGHSQNKEGLRIITGPESVELGKRVLAHCRRKLPGYMVPTYVLQLSYIPLSPNNKAEVKELRNLFNDIDPAQLVSPSGPSRAIQDSRLSDTAQRILVVLAGMGSVNTSQAGPLTSVLELGMDSISVLQLSAALRREGLTSSTPEIILRHPKLGDLAAALDSKVAPAVSASISAARQLVRACNHRHRAQVLRELEIQPNQIEYIAPCSPLQEGMISRSKSLGLEGAYFNTFRFQVAEGISISQLRMAWQKVYETCAILRTCFVGTTNGHVQVAVSSVPFPWTEITATPDENLEDLLADYRRSWIEANQDNIDRPLDFLSVDTSGTSGSPFFVVHIFHGLYDASSFELLLNRVADEYHHVEKAGNEPGFLDGLIHGPLRNYSSCNSFWADYLKGALPQPFPRISSHPSVQPIHSTRCIPFETLDEIRVSLGVTHQALVLAIWVSSIQDILSNTGCIGLIASGRSMSLEGSENIVGPLFNTLPFRASLAPDETWSSLIEKCHNFSVATIPFQHVALRDIQKWCSSGQPLFDTLFSFQRESTQPIHRGNLWTELDSNAHPDFPLAFEATLTADRKLNLLIVTQGGIADSDALTNLLSRVEKVAQTLARDPGSRITQNRSGQINTHGLAKMMRQIGDEKDDSCFAWTPTAMLIREELSILAQTPAENIAPTASLLELGLDSIDAVKLSSRLRKVGLNISTSQLLRAKSIYELVGYVNDHQTNGHINGHTNGRTNGNSAANGALIPNSTSTALEAHLESTGFNLHGVERVLPVTPLQESMITGMIQSDFRKYFNHDILELDPEVDIDRLKSAWRTVVEGSPILRTSFATLESPDFVSAYCQLVRRAPQPFIFEPTGISNLHDAVEEARKRACEANGTEDLLQLTFASVRSRRYFILSIAHPLYDGWSLELLHRDVHAAYNGTYSPRPSYEEYLDRITGWSNSEARTFWSDFLASTTPTTLPETTSKATSNPMQTIRQEATCSIPLSDLKSFCRRIAVSPHVLGQACWSALLATRTQLLDVSFGVVLAGRDSEFAETLMFPTMNTVAMRSVLHGDVRGWLQYMQENLTSITQFQHFPLRAAQKLARNSGGGPMFNSLFIYQPRLSSTAPNSKPLTKSIGGSSDVDFPVCVEMEMGEDGIIWRVACASNYLVEGDPNLILDQLNLVMDYLVNSPAAEVLTFNGPQISVCGLPSFTPMPFKAHNQASELILDDEEVLEWSETERQVRTVLARFSEIPVSSIRKDHGIYHLGLDSISAIKASSLLRKNNIPLTSRQLLEARSIADMARLADAPRVANGAHAGENGVNNTISLGDIDTAMLLASNNLKLISLEDVLPATAMQTHMLSAWQNTNGQAYYPTFRYHLDGPVSLQTIISAWQMLLRKTPILRTSFLATTSEIVPFVQLIHRLESNHDNGFVDGNTWYSRKVQETDQPLVSLRVDFKGGAHWDLKLTIHHALYDGVSLPIIMERLRILCGNNRLHEGWSYEAPWKKLLHMQTNNIERERRQSFWVKYLQGARTTILFPPRCLATGSGALNRPMGRISYLRRSAMTDISRLRSICVKRGVTLQAVFFAACAKHQATQRNDNGDLVFGIYMANRHLVGGLESLPYPTLCLVPLRIRQPLELDIGSIADAVQHDIHLISSSSHLLAGLWEINSWTGITIDCFINFLSIPSPSDENEYNGATLQADADGDAEVAPRTNPVNGVNKWNIGNRVRYAYLNAVDIEVSIQNASMDIGVFGPADSTDSHQAGAVVSGVIGALGGLI